MIIKIIEAREIKNGVSKNNIPYRIQEVKCLEVVDDEGARAQRFIATVKNDKVDAYDLHTGDIVEADTYMQLSEYTNKDGSLYEKNVISLRNLKKVYSTNAAQQAQQAVQQAPFMQQNPADPFSGAY